MMNHQCNHCDPEEVLFPGSTDAEARKLLDHFFSICESLMFIVDERQRLVQVNPQAIATLGYSTANEIKGMFFLDVVDEKNRDEMRVNLGKPLADVKHMESLAFVAVDGKRIHTEARIARGRVDEKEFFFISAKDITRYKPSEEKFKKAFHSTSVIMLIFSLDEGVILEVNEAACAMTGYKTEEMIGKTIVELNLYPDRGDRKMIRDRLLDLAALKDCEVRIRNRNGWDCYGLFSMDVLFLENRQCVLAVGSDFTQRKKAEEELMKAFKAQGKQKAIIEIKSRELEKAKKKIEEEASLVEESSRHKSEFIANMSHELRTPLNSIILLADLLTQNRDARLTEKELEFASVILAAGKDLLSLINDVLDLSKVEAGRMEINMSQVSLEYLCRKLRGYFSEMADVKGLEFGIYPESGLTEHLVVDVQKLEQILKNLTSNAIKFTEKGSVEIFIHRPSPETDLSMIGLNGLNPSNSIAFSVKDTGIGIAPEKKDVIFECFIQADKDITETYGGTGLGLPVSRVLAQLLGGDIMLESQPMKGSTFTLYIPDSTLGACEKTNGDAMGFLSGSAISGITKNVGLKLKGKKILIADDDMRTVYALIQNFEGLSVEVLVAWDGVRCMNKLEANLDTALVLLDISMPEMDGFQVLELIRSDERMKGIPVVVITANVMEGDEKKCIEAGADAYMAKPLDFDKLLGVMEGVL
ncbi:MAG: PAS domain S-box protein [Desulfobacteraceae bacterium]|jgi:PAS domain S-box-containing protein